MKRITKSGTRQSRRISHLSTISYPKTRAERFEKTGRVYIIYYNGPLFLSSEFPHVRLIATRSSSYQLNCNSSKALGLGPSIDRSEPISKL